MPTKRHHWIVRVTHWVNAIALTLMVGSGLRIFNAYPAFARKGETFCCYPFEHRAIPSFLTFGGWLGGARNWHFAMMWLLTINGLLYIAFLYLHGEWRDLAPRKGDVHDSIDMIRFYLRLSPTHPRQGKHNALQKSAYFTMPLVGILAVVTGFAVWKPVQLGLLTSLFGGYVWARYWHFMAMLVLVILALGHIFMVFAVDPYSLPSMFTGNYDESKSPEARNARPFSFGKRARHAESAPVVAAAVAAPVVDPAPAAPVHEAHPDVHSDTRFDPVTHSDADSDPRPDSDLI